MSTAKRAGLRALYTVGCLVTSTVLQLAAAYGQRQALIFIPADGRAPVVQNAEFSNGPALHTIVDKTAIRAEVLIFLKSGSKHELLTTAALPAGDLIQGQVPLRSRGIVTLTRSLKTAACSEQPGGARTVRFIYFEVSVESELGMPFEERWIEQEPLQSRRFRDYRAFGEASGGLPVLSEQGPLSERVRILEKSASPTILHQLAEECPSGNTLLVPIITGTARGKDWRALKRHVEAYNRFVWVTVRPSAQQALEHARRQLQLGVALEVSLQSEVRGTVSVAISVANHRRKFVRLLR